MKKTNLTLALILFVLSLTSQSNWKKVESNSNLRFNAISFGTEQVGYIGAEGGTLLKTTDGGRNWSVILIDSSLIGIPMDIVDVDFQSATHGYIVYNYSQTPVSHRGGVLFTRNGGASWIASSLGMCGPFGSYMIDTANGFFFGATCFGGRTIDKITNRSFVNTTYNTGYNDFLRGMDFFNPTYGITAGDNGYVYRTTNAGVKWDTVVPAFSESFYDIKFVNDSLVFAVIDSSDNSVMFSSDSGTTWQVFTNSLTFHYPVMKALAVSSSDTVFTVGKSSTTGEPIILWGAENGTWNVFNVSKSGGFNAIDVTGSDRVFAVGDSGMIYTNRDFIVSIDEKESTYKLAVYPNPVQSMLTVSSENMQSIELIDLKGRVVLNQIKVNSTSEKLSLEYQPKGVYLLRVTYRNGSIQHQKLIVN